MCQPCLARASGVIWSCRMLPARAALTGGAVVVDAAPPAPSTLDQPRAELVPASDISGAVLHALEAGAASPTCPHKSQSCAWGQAAAAAVALTPPRADQPAAGWAAAAQAAATVCGPCMWLACGACQYAECSRTPTSPAPPEQRSLFQAVSQARCMPAAAARYAAAKAAALREPRRAHKSQDLRRPAARGKRRSPRPPSAREVLEAAAGADVRRGLLRISGGTGRSGVLILTCVTAHAPAFVRGARAGKRSASTGGAPAAARGALKSASGAATGLRAAQPTRRAAPAF
jgi:hypothetical protein